MPYDFRWQDDAHSIIRLDIHDEVTWELWHKAVDQIVAQLDETPHRVDLIFNDSVGFPPGNSLNHLRASNMRMRACPNLGIIVTVSSRSLSVFTRIMVGIVARLSGRSAPDQRLFVETLDEALALIARDRAQAKNVV